MKIHWTWRVTDEKGSEVITHPTVTKEARNGARARGWKVQRVMVLR